MNIPSQYVNASGSASAPVTPASDTWATYASPRVSGNPRRVTPFRPYKRGKSAAWARAALLNAGYVGPLAQ